MQAVILMTGLVVVCALGTHQVGGPTVVFYTAKELGRINLNKLVVSFYSLYWGRKPQQNIHPIDLCSKSVDLGSIHL